MTIFLTRRVGGLRVEGALLRESRNPLDLADIVAMSPAGEEASSMGPREQGFAAPEFYTRTKTIYTCA
jgi:hypothetical protein